MGMIDIFYQGEQLGEVQHLALEANSTFGVLQAAIREKHGIVYETFLFLENGEEVIEELCLHLRTCPRCKPQGPYTPLPSCRGYGWFQRSRGGASLLSCRHRSEDQAMGRRREVRDDPGGSR